MFSINCVTNVICLNSHRIALQMIWRHVNRPETDHLWKMLKMFKESRVKIVQIGLKRKKEKEKRKRGKKEQKKQNKTKQNKTKKAGNFSNKKAEISQKAGKFQVYTDNTQNGTRPDVRTENAWNNLFMMIHIMQVWKAKKNNKKYFYGKQQNRLAVKALKTNKPHAYRENRVCKTSPLTWWMDSFYNWTIICLL